MVPAFPLDGGRIARAIAWQLTGDRHKATRFSAYLGQGFAVLMMGYGVYRLLDDGDRSGGLWWLVLGWMLGGSARAAVAQSRFADRLDGVTAGDIMDAEPVTIPADLAVERAYDEYFLRYQGWPWFAGRRGRRALRRPRPPRRGRARRPRGRPRAARPRPSPPTPSEVRTDTPLESLLGVGAAAHASAR